MLLAIISPAKKLAVTTAYSGRTTQPSFKKEAALLVKLLQQKTPAQLASLMRISEKLAYLNYTRYQMFKPRTYSNKNAMPALFLFQGDVYQGLQANTFNTKDLAFCEKSLCILSGLYGLLSPLDLIQPYRLEMGTTLPNPKGDNLYAFWQNIITQTINQKLITSGAQYLVNLASNEYFSVIDKMALGKPIIKIEFKEEKQGKLKTIALHAKRARGAMVHFMVKNRCKTLTDLQTFNEMNYQFNRALSTHDTLSFIR